MQYITFVHQQANYDSYTWAENLLRAGIGFVSEFFEYKNSYAPDELGDCLFWWSILTAEFGSVPKNEFNPEARTNFNPINILDAIEKLTRVGEVSPSSEKVDRLVTIINNELSAFYWKYLHNSEYTLEEIQEMNRRKLIKRSEN
ncbi:MAG: hypothetical protein ACRDBG_16640 [Waterburya sp.]